MAEGRPQNRERTSSRDDFPQGVKQTCGGRVSFVCSNPDCQRMTRGPHSDPGEVINVGLPATFVLHRQAGSKS